MWAIKNRKGDWFSFTTDADGVWSPNYGEISSDESSTENCAKEFGGKAVELTEKSKVNVSDEEAKMLKQAHMDSYWATSVIHDYCASHTKDLNDTKTKAFEDRLIRAYIVGYTIAIKHFKVRVPYVKALGGMWFYLDDYNNLGATYAKSEAKPFTLEEINKYGLQNCTREMVK